jgi:transcriptional regulator with XRE-family HTH domain
MVITNNKKNKSSNSKVTNNSVKIKYNDNDYDIASEKIEYYSIGQRVRKYRKAYNLSQEQLAEQIGISTTHLSHIETGNTKLSLPVLVRLADALNVQTDELLYEQEKNSKSSAKEEILNILDSCSTKESYILLDILKSVKISLDKYI